MPRKTWILRRGRPMIRVWVAAIAGGQPMSRVLLADTGASPDPSPFHLILDYQDCQHFGSPLPQNVRLRGAYAGIFQVFLVQVQVPELNFDQPVPVIGVTSLPSGFDGLACFPFLNHFHYGNFGDSRRFGLEI